VLLSSSCDTDTSSSFLIHALELFVFSKVQVESEIHLLAAVRKKEGSKHSASEEQASGMSVTMMELDDERTLLINSGVLMIKHHPCSLFIHLFKEVLNLHTHSPTQCHCMHSSSTIKVLNCVEILFDIHANVWLTDECVVNNGLMGSENH
jgi:hypothetical protein